MKNFYLLKSYAAIIAFLLMNLGSIQAQNGPVYDTYTNLTATVSTGLSANIINGVFVKGSTVYVATQGGGLCISTDGGANFTNKTTTNGLGNNSVKGVYTSGSNIYAATFGGGLSISTDSAAVL